MRPRLGKMNTEAGDHKENRYAVVSILEEEEGNVKKNRLVRRKIDWIQLAVVLKMEMIPNMVKKNPKGSETS